MIERRLCPKPTDHEPDVPPRTDGRPNDGSVSIPPAANAVSPLTSSSRYPSSSGPRCLRRPTALVSAPTSTLSAPFAQKPAIPHMLNSGLEGASRRREDNLASILPGQSNCEAAPASNCPAHTLAASFGAIGGLAV